MGIHDLAKDVAMFLRGYAYDQDSASSAEARLTRTELPFKFAIFLSMRGENIFVRGEFPKNVSGEIQPVKIKIKTDEQIASDIKKRFIPDYEAAIRQMVQAKSITDTMDDEAKETIASLAAAIGTSPLPHSPNSFVGDWGGPDYAGYGKLEAKINPDNTVSVSVLSGLTPKEFKQILVHLRLVAIKREVKPKEKNDQKNAVDSSLQVS